MTREQRDMLRALLHYAETPGDFTQEEARDVLDEAVALLYSPEMEALGKEK